MHYAAHGHTAADVIYERADADQPFMALTTFEGELPAIKDINTQLPKSELLVVAKLSKGKNLNWWKSVAMGLIKPMDTEIMCVLHSFG